MNRTCWHHPQVPEIVEELLGGDLNAALQAERQRQAERQQQQRPGDPSP